MEENVATLRVRICGKELEQLSAVMGGFTGQVGPTGTNSAQSQPDWCNKKVPVGQEVGKLLRARPVETLHNQDLGQWTRPNS